MILLKITPKKGRIILKKLVKKKIIRLKRKIYTIDIVSVVSTFCLKLDLSLKILSGLYFSLMNSSYFKSFLFAIDTIY